MTRTNLVVGLAGMPGAGKSIAVGIAKGRDYKIVVMGDEVREEAKKRNVKPTPKNLGRIMLELRQTEGDSAIAKRCIPKIEKTKEQKILVDGIRSLSEVYEFKKHFPSFILVGVHASPETRFKRLFHRMRSDDPENLQVFQERDMRELSIGLGNALALAQHTIVNEGRIANVKDEVKKVLNRIEDGWKR